MEIADSPKYAEEKLAELTLLELTALVTYHNKKYWQDNDPEISDNDYDRLIQALA